MNKIFNKTKLLSVGALLAFAISQQAGAAVVTFGGQAATDGSGLTSTFIDSSNIIADVSAGYFVETFDTATAIPAFPLTPNTNYNIPGASAGCAINSPLMMTQSDPGVLNVRTGSVVNVAAAPANNTTCYGYTTPVGAGLSYIDIDYTAFLATIGMVDASLAGSSINYLGFYWGSVDTYNTFEFYSNGNLVTSVSGTSLLADLGGVSGDQLSDKSNVYVNLDFSFAEAFNRIRIISSGVAGEFDNIVIGLSQRPVPAPAGLAFLGLGLLGLGLRKRLKK